ncbi:PREDICTED: receptor-transporting protein 3 [Galeopterus variegatus]|uniref:Receptor-transporting protein 3 n=1 Tax=Galeopterus variegatus TaxID=482537 RepID=A0ABM0RIB3_GALVR|nr:PREDICTED: receptor-transporting protein 3 [Galeopterus variegatus]
MEVWKQMFQELMQEVKPWHRWTLTPDKGLLPSVLQPGWMQYQQWTFARFQCSSCSRSWASAHVQVLFHMHWSEGTSSGQVKMRVFAQRCKKCSQPLFEAPEFTQENISRILNNLVLRILKKCYREGFKLVEEIPMVKEVSLEGPHDSDNCEACLQGFCAQSGLRPAMQSPRPPALPTLSKVAEGPRVTATVIDLPCSQPPPKDNKPLESKVHPKIANPPKAANTPKVSKTSKPSTAPRCPAQQLPPASSPTPGMATQVPSPTKSRMAADAGSLGDFRWWWLTGQRWTGCRRQEGVANALSAPPLGSEALGASSGGSVVITRVDADIGGVWLKPSTSHRSSSGGQGASSGLVVISGLDAVIEGCG